MFRSTRQMKDSNGPAENIPEVMRPSSELLAANLLQFTSDVRQFS